MNAQPTWHRQLPRAARFHSQKKQLTQYVSASDAWRLRIHPLVRPSTCGSSDGAEKQAIMRLVIFPPSVTVYNTRAVTSHTTSDIWVSTCSHKADDIIKWIGRAPVFLRLYWSTFANGICVFFLPRNHEGYSDQCQQTHPHSEALINNKQRCTKRHPCKLMRACPALCVTVQTPHMLA